MRKKSILRNLGILPVLLVLFNLPAFNQLVTNTNTGLTYSTIQAAIDAPATLNGHTLTVAAGVYTENVLVNKELTINGPKAGVDGNDGSRGTGEATVQPAVIYYGDGVYWATGGKIFNITADNVTIDGFTIDGDNPLLDAPYVVNGANIDCESGISSHGGYAGADPDLAGDNLVLKNNVIKNLMGYGIIMWCAATLPTSQSAQINHNRFYNILFAGILLYQNYYATIENNTMSDMPSGISVSLFYGQNTSSNTGRIKHNTINTKIMERNDGYSVSALVGIHMIFLYNGITNAWEVSENTVNNLVERSTGSHGIVVSHCEGQTLSVHDNVISNFENGYLLHSSVNFWTPGALPAAISGGTVSNCTYGVTVINLSEWVGDNPTDHYQVNGLTIQNCTTAGVFATGENVNYDAGFGFNTPTNVYVDVNNCKINNNPVGILLNSPLCSATAHNNDLSGNTASIKTGLFKYQNPTPPVDASCNWYGHWSGPKNYKYVGALGDSVVGNITFIPWLTDGTDIDVAQGFQPVPGSCSNNCGSNYVKGGNNYKLLVCYDGKTLCTPVSEGKLLKDGTILHKDDAFYYLDNGGTLGACTLPSITNAGSIIPEAMLPEKLKVSSFPNPFINSTTLKYELPFDGKISIKVYDAMGKEVASLINSEKKAGVYTVNFDASRLSKGMYYYKLTASSKEKEYTQSGKMLKQ